MRTPVEMEVRQIRERTVYEVTVMRGSGSVDDPKRYVVQHWSPHGEFLMESDDFLDKDRWKHSDPEPIKPPNGMNHRNANEETK